MILQLLKRLGTAVMVPIILFEEWGWRPLARGMQWLASRPVFRALEDLIRRASPRLSLALFVVPVLVLLPFKLGALWFLGHGQKALGISIILLAKLVSTALLGRLFLLTEPQLMTFPWFARCYRWWRSTKERVLKQVRATGVWQRAAALSVQVRQQLKRWRS